MRPLVGSISRLIIFMVVVLPQPDGPTSTQISPSATSRSRWSTATWPLPYRLVTSSSRITTKHPLGSSAEGSGGLATTVSPVGASAVLALQDPWVRWDWVREHGDLIRERLQQHIELTLWTVGIGIVIAL